MPAETSETARLRLVSNHAGGRRDHRRKEGARGEADEDAVRQLELDERLCAARQHQRQPEQDRADQHDDAGAEAVAGRAPAEGAERP